jgi:outer membrane lipoprotein carrier protein
MTGLAPLVALLIAVSAPSGQEPTALDAARALQAHYDSVRDFTADFTQTYVGGVLRKRITEQGRVRVKKPGRMRWDYTQPEHKVFVSDGSETYSYIPADHQVYVTPMPEGDEATTAVLFLTGRGDLVRDFDVQYARDVTVDPDEAALRLDPKRPDRDYDWIVIVFDRQNWQIRKLVAADSQGGTSTFQFRNMRENVGLSDDVFTFKIPRGVDVIRSKKPPA